MEQAFQGTIQGALERVKELTPVDTGWLRSNWQAVRESDALALSAAVRSGVTGEGQESWAEIGFGFVGGILGGLAGTALGAGPVTGFAGSIAGGVAGDIAARAIYRALVPRIGEVVVITNPVPYARAVEYGRQIQRKDGGITHIQGRGMLQQTISEMPQIAERAVRRVTGQGV